MGSHDAITQNSGGVARTAQQIGGAVFIVSCVGEPLKRIYKASQEKKENSSPRGAEWVLFFYLTAPSSVFQKRTGLCNRTL
jgi:hypothetical protein